MELKIRAKDLYKYLSKIKYTKFWKRPKFLKFYDKIDIYIKTKKDYNCFKVIFYSYFWLLEDYKVTIHNLSVERFFKDTPLAITRWVNLEKRLELGEVQFEPEGE